LRSSPEQTPAPVRRAPLHRTCIPRIKHTNSDNFSHHNARPPSHSLPMSLPPRARPSTAGRPPSLPQPPSPSPAATHRSVAAARACVDTTRDAQLQATQSQWSPASSHRGDSKAAASPLPSPWAAASHRSQQSSNDATATPRTSYTGIRHLLAASDINTDAYPDPSWQPSQNSGTTGGSIDHLFASTGTASAVADNECVRSCTTPPPNAAARNTTLCYNCQSNIIQHLVTIVKAI
jgi:hypothetical protein